MINYVRNLLLAAALCGAAFACTMGGAAFALQRPDLAHVRTDIASALRADYSTDPAQFSLPLVPEIIEDAARDEAAAPRTTSTEGPPPAASEEDGAVAEGTADAGDDGNSERRTATPRSGPATVGPGATPTLRTPVLPLPTLTLPVPTLTLPAALATPTPWPRTATPKPTDTPRPASTATPTTPPATPTRTPNSGCDNSGPGGGSSGPGNGCDSTPTPTRTACPIDVAPLPPICL